MIRALAIIFLFALFTNQANAQTNDMGIPSGEEVMALEMAKAQAKKERVTTRG